MSIGQNILEAFDIVLDKKLEDAFQNIPKMIIAEIVEKDMSTNTYSIKYQNAIFKNVLSNNSENYERGDVVQVLTDNENYAITGRLSQSNARSMYNNYTAQILCEPEITLNWIQQNWTTAEGSDLTVVLYARNGSYNCGFTADDVNNFTNALLNTETIECRAAFTFEGNLLASKCQLKITLVDIRGGDNENNGVVQRTKIVTLDFEKIRQNRKQSLSKIINLEPTEGSWQIDLITLERSHRLDKILKIGELVLYVKSATPLEEQNEMFIESEKTVFEDSDADSTELTQNVTIKSPSGGYFYSPDLQYLWGAEEPTVIKTDKKRYNKALGEGWVVIEKSPSKSFNIKRSLITDAKRCFKCVAMIEEQIIASSTIEITNAKDPYDLGALSVTTNDQSKKTVVTTPSTFEFEEGDFCYAVQKTYDTNEIVYYSDKLADSNNDGKITFTRPTATINFVNIFTCSIYQNDRYMGSRSAYIFSDLKNQDASLINEYKTFAVIKNQVNENSKYFNQIQWYNSEEKAYQNAYNGIDGATRTYKYKDKDGNEHTEENVSALKDLRELAEQNDGSYAPPYGYYLWYKALLLTNTGNSTTIYSRVSPDEDWKKAVQKVETLYHCARGIDELDVPEVIENTQNKEQDEKNGHKNKTYTVEKHGWTTFKEAGAPTQNKPQKFSVTIQYYNDGSIDVLQPTLVDAYVKGSISDSKIKSIQISPSSSRVSQAIITIEYCITDPAIVSHTGEYIMDAPEIDNHTAQFTNTFSLGWSKDFKTQPTTFFKYEKNKDLSEEQQDNFLWAKAKIKYTADTKEEKEQETYFVVASTLASLKTIKETKQTFAAGSAEEKPVTGWSADFEDVLRNAKKDSKTGIWTSISSVYDVFLGDSNKAGQDTVLYSETYDNASTKILDWVAESDTHYFDGSKLYTGSVQADAINTTSLEAVSLNIGGWITQSQAFYKIGQKVEEKEVRDVNVALLGGGSFSTEARSNPDMIQRFAVGPMEELTVSKLSKDITIKNSVPYQINETVGEGEDKIVYKFAIDFYIIDYCETSKGRKQDETWIDVAETEVEAKPFGIECKSLKYYGNNLSDFKELTTKSDIENTIFIKECEHTNNNTRHKYSLWFKEQITSLQEARIFYNIALVTGITKPVLQITGDGSIYAKKGNIAGWRMDPSKNQLSTGDPDRNNFVALNAGSTEYTIGGIKGTNWRLIANNSFGVNSLGEMYCSKAYISGSSKIASWNISDTDIFSTTEWSELDANSSYKYKRNRIILRSSKKDVSAFAVATDYSNDKENIGHTEWPLNIAKTGLIQANNAQLLGGSIAEWTITNNSLQKGTFGNSESSWLLSTPIKAEAFGSNEVKNWVIGISNAFGVTENGELFLSGTNSGVYFSNNGCVSIEPKIITLQGIPRTSGVDYITTIEPDKTSCRDLNKNMQTEYSALGITGKTGGGVPVGKLQPYYEDNSQGMQFIDVSTLRLYADNVGIGRIENNAAGKIRIGNNASTVTINGDNIIIGNTDTNTTTIIDGMKWRDVIAALNEHGIIIG